MPAANPEIITDNVLSPEFAPGLVAEGADLLENPSGLITRFGNLSDSSRTEPDENTYLILDHNPGGPTQGYDYGRHFLFQGHEMPNGNTNRAYVTRINLDVAHPDHRITLMTPGDANGLTGFNSIDGSTWDPFSRTLLFTQEDGAIGGVIEMGADFDPNTGGGAGLRTLYGSLGRGGYEGIHPDDRGNILIVEDVGGSTVPQGTISWAVWEKSEFVRLPIRSYISGRPDSWQIAGAPSLDQRQSGRVRSILNGASDGETSLSDNQLLLHTVGASWPVQWITIHDTAINGTGAFDANALAKAARRHAIQAPGERAVPAWFTLSDLLLRHHWRHR